MLWRKYVSARQRPRRFLLLVLLINLLANGFKLLHQLELIQLQLPLLVLYLRRRQELQCKEAETKHPRNPSESDP